MEMQGMWSRKGWKMQTKEVRKVRCFTGSYRKETTIEQAAYYTFKSGSAGFFFCTGTKAEECSNYCLLKNLKLYKILVEKCLFLG
jgi:hypothetical protein